MSDLNESRIGTVSISRKLSDGNYGGTEVFFAMQIPLDRPLEQGELDLATANANEAYAMLKAMVNTQLGLPAEDARAAAAFQRVFGPETTVVEVGVPVEAANVVPLPSSAPTQDDIPASPPHDPNDWRNHTPQQKAEIAEWVKARFAKYPHEFWDNRGTKTNPKAPDVKHKATGAAGWL